MWWQTKRRRQESKEIGRNGSINNNRRADDRCGARLTTADVKGELNRCSIEDRSIDGMCEIVG